RDNDVYYTECYRSFNCGTIANITYPFWGGSRPQFCGLPAFRVECYEDEFPIFEYQEQKYRVLKIDQHLRTMTITRMDLMEGTCLHEFRNTSIMDSTLFHMTPAVKSLSIFYGCLDTMKNISNEFKCFYDFIRKSAFFIDDIFLDRELPLFVNSCITSIKVPILQSTLNDLERGNINLQEALNQGFDTQYIDHPDCLTCASSGGFCSSNSSSSSSSFTCYCRNKPHACTCNDPGMFFWNPVILRSVISASKGLLSISVLLLPICSSTINKSMIGIIMALIKHRSKHVDGKMKIEGLVSSRRYTYKDIKRMTNSFKEKLGEGGYGCVYKGKLRDDQFVAVKLLKKPKGNAEEFFNEVASISRTSHINVVNLLGFCFEGSKRALQLSWDTLYQISLGIAHGLEYLHRGCNTRILHLDIKPHNILLDANYRPKISDFGLAKICPGEESIVSLLGARGTAGYIAPELILRNIGRVSHKSDVYSYGMMILEMVGRRKNIEVTVDHTSEIYFPHWVHRRLELREELGLHGITNEEDEGIAKKMIVIGLWCIQINLRARPSMTEVVEMLKGSVETLQIPPKPSLSSLSRSPEACPYYGCSDTTCKMKNMQSHDLYS
ncbi:hypothetical protein EUGRSUZ_B00766, partial [Eucalyptus grandis]